MYKHLHGELGEIQSFLSTSAVFQHIPPEELTEMAHLFRIERHRAGTVILRQGGYSPALYFLRSGRLAVRIQRGKWEETVAYLQPPAMVGELSFLTGRSCVANVEVVVDAELVFLPKEAVQKLPKQGEAIFHGLLQEIAGRLQETVTCGAKVSESPIVLLNNHPNWEAPFSFASELARSLARQSKQKTLLVNLGTSSQREVCSIDGSANACSLDMIADAENLRADVAQKLTGWKSSFENVLLNPVGPHIASIAKTIEDFTNCRGHLVGPGDPLPGEMDGQHFIVQSDAHPTLPFLSCNQQLISDAISSESAFSCGRPVSPKFQRTVDSIARCIAGIQIGIVLGGGATWGWTHVGVLEALEDARLPIDCIVGNSMGSFIGACHSTGITINELKAMGAYYGKHIWRLYEYRLWRMHLFSEKAYMQLFRRCFGDRLVNRTEIPFWANAVDIQTGEELTIRTGTLISCVRGAMALPGILPTFPYDSGLLVDGGFTNTIPVNLVREMGCHFSIGVNAVAEIGSRKVSHRYPFNFFEVIMRCLFVVAREIGQARAEEGADIVFAPNLSNIGVFQFSRIPEIIECGRRATEENLPAILASYQSLKTDSTRASYKSFRRILEKRPAV